MLTLLGRVVPVLLVALLIVNLVQRGLTRAGGHPGAPAAEEPRQPDPAPPGAPPGAPPPVPAAAGHARRAASLIAAGIVLALWCAVLLGRRFHAPEWTGVPMLLAAAGAAFALRRRLGVFPLRCRWCGRRLPAGVVLGFDAPATARYEAAACPSSDCRPARTQRPVP